MIDIEIQQSSEESSVGLEGNVGHKWNKGNDRMNGGEKR